MGKFLALFQLIPVIIKAVIQIEESIPLSGVGVTKIDLLVNILKAFYDAEESIRKEFPWDKLKSIIMSAVSIIVTAFKSLGIFKGKETE